ncbi:MAG: precorrin-2 C(20)-methyltransferase [Spirochaetia bacterium]|nr:precorrin-2 C(20)-methyltransferase [Spirochaetia bacterium]
MTKYGILYGIGAGPGDPELITLKGHRILEQTHVIAFPEATAGAGSYAGSIVEKLVDASQKLMLPLVFPMTKDKAILEEKWNVAVDAIIKPLEAGKNVAFVSEGDPLFFSTFIHLMELIKLQNPNIQIEIIPGISSMHGAAASLGWGLAIGDQKVAVIPATSDMEEMSEELDRHDTVVFYKVAKVAALIVELLRKKNLIDKSAIVSKATSSDENIYLDLNDLPERIPYLSLMIVRKQEM